MSDDAEDIRVQDGGAEPELEQILQEPVYPLAVPVSVADPVPVRQLPSPRWSAFTTNLTYISDVAGQRGVETLLGYDPRRKRVTLMSADAAFVVGHDKSGVEAGVGATFWPQNVPFVLESCGPVYARSRFAGTIALGVTVEYWAD